MAAITPIVFDGSFSNIRTGATQATTGQTDWINVPQWATYCDVFINVSAVAGTTPTLTPSFLAADPTARDDGKAVQIHGNLTTPPTAASFNRITLGPATAGIADDLSLSATGAGYAIVACVLPPLLGVKILNDRADGDETYSYTVSVCFR